MCFNPEQCSYNSELMVDNAAHTERMKYQMQVTALLSRSSDTLTLHSVYLKGPSVFFQIKISITHKAMNNTFETYH